MEVAILEITLISLHIHTGGIVNILVDYPRGKMFKIR